MQSISAQLYQAINDDDADLIRRLLESYPLELNAYTFLAGQTWLGYAAQVGKLVAVDALVGLGANVNIGDQTYGAKPLCSACSNGNHLVAEYLIQCGSDLDVETSVRNPLFSSIVGRSLECVTVILSAGIDTQIRYSSHTMSDMDAVAFALMRGETECATRIAKWNTGADEIAVAGTLAAAEIIAGRNARS